LKNVIDIIFVHFVDIEYITRQKARAQNNLRICCIPFNWIMLSCIMALTFGSYWVYDTPGAIETQLQDWFGPDYTDSKNTDLYSVYSWPNTVLAFFGGFILDKVTGIRKGQINNKIKTID
jgi:hypothetical protein